MVARDVTAAMLVDDNKIANSIQTFQEQNYENLR